MVPMASLSGATTISIKAATDAIINSMPIIPLYFLSKVSDIPSEKSPTTSNIPIVCNPIEDAIIVAPTSFPWSLAASIAEMSVPNRTTHIGRVTKSYNPPISAKWLLRLFSLFNVRAR